MKYKKILPYILSFSMLLTACGGNGADNKQAQEKTETEQTEVEE